MTATEEGSGGGSFKELRKKHLPLFDKAVHRHDRGWPHPSPERPKPEPKGGWKTVGIFHFRHEEDEEED